MDKQPILITGVERSGSTMIAKILSMCGVWSGTCNNMFENHAFCAMNQRILEQHPLLMPDRTGLQISVNWKDEVEKALIRDHYPGHAWMIKQSGLARLWPIWNYAYPDAKWLIIRRRTGDVIQSSMKTGYMRLFKDPENLEKLGLTSEEEGWLWWIHEYENRFVDMIQAGLNCRVIWPERMVYGNYQQIFETVEWLGLKWNNNIPKVIDPLLNKSREVMHENNY